ncbi:ribosylnicotinamide kinase, partial [Coemansia thaxteri]
TDSQVPVHAEVAIQDWDCPEAFDMTRLVDEIRKTRGQLEHSGDPNCKEIYGIRNNHASQWANPPEDVDQLISAAALASIKQLVLEQLNVHDTSQVPFTIILVDGILLFHDGDITPRQYPGAECDAGVFICAQYGTLKARRESRTAYSTVEGIWTDPAGYFDVIVWPNFIKYHSSFVAANPELATRIATNGSVVNTPDLWKDKVIVCSSETPAEDTLRQCVKAVIEMWRSRAKSARD